MRPLTPDEAALWARVMASVRPIRPRAAPSAPPAAAAAAPSPAAKSHARIASPLKKPAAPRAPISSVRPIPGTTLDGSWDKQLSRGLVSPDRSIDLHGHNL
ncbi:MAG: DNA mismatch repair protein MutS, partial [Sphingomonas bacterium]